VFQNAQRFIPPSVVGALKNGNYS